MCVYIGGRRGRRRMKWMFSQLVGLAGQVN
jgi:hypothetical protein